MKTKAYAEMFAVEDNHWWYIGLHDLILLLTRILFPEKHLNILDAGCGTGGLLAILNQAGHKTEGLDYSEEALFFCRERGLNHVSKADVNNWTPRPNSYDLITSIDVLCHKWVQDETKVLRSMATGLKEGGVLMLNYPAFPLLRRQHDNVVMIQKRYTKKDLLKILSEAGLEPVLLSYRLPYAFITLVLLRIFEMGRNPNPNAKSDIANIPPKLINQTLIQLNKLENHFIARGVSIPFGSSVFVVARKTT